MIRQLTVFLENRPGRLTALAAALGGAGVQMSALTVADTAEYGIVRIVCDKPDVAAGALEAAGFTATIAEVTAVEVPHEPGGLARVLAVLDETGADIAYSYCFANARGGASVALKCDRQIEPALVGAGFTVISQADLG